MCVCVQCSRRSSLLEYVGLYMQRASTDTAMEVKRGGSSRVRRCNPKLSVCSKPTEKGRLQAVLCARKRRGDRPLSPCTELKKNVLCVKNEKPSESVRRSMQNTPNRKRQAENPEHQHAPTQHSYYVPVPFRGGEKPHRWCA